MLEWDENDCRKKVESRNLHIFAYTYTYHLCGKRKMAENNSFRKKKLKFPNIIDAPPRLASASQKWAYSQNVPYIFMPLSL